MRVLFFGVGVIGTVYAGRISKSKQKVEVTVLARNGSQRLKDIQKNGLFLLEEFEEKQGKLEKIKVAIISELKPNDIYDFVFVSIRNDNLKEVLPILSQNKSKSFVFMVNTSKGYQEWIKIIGKDKIIAAFPGLGGEIENGIVKYILSKNKGLTTIGEIDGTITDRIKRLSNLLKNADFGVSICSCMDSWQKTHVGFVLPIAYGIYVNQKENSNFSSFSENKKLINQVNLAIKDNLQFIKDSKIGVYPYHLRIFNWVPLFILNYILAKKMKTKFAQIALVCHAIKGKKEIEILCQDFFRLVDQKGYKVKEFKKLVKMAKDKNS